MSALRIALLDRTDSGYSRELETALRAAGHEPRLLGDRAIPAAEALLRRRGFTPALSHVPPAALQLVRGDFDVAHAFSGPDSAAALAWRRVSRRPVVFTWTEVPDRGTVADARLRLATLARAVEESDAVTAATEEILRAVERWFACSPAVVAARDAAVYGQLYARLQKTGVST